VSCAIIPTIEAKLKSIRGKRMKTQSLKIRVLTLLSLPILLTATIAQKRTTILGDAYTGKVVAVDANTREITIEYPDKTQSKRLSAILPEGYKVTRGDGADHEVQMEDFKLGRLVRIFAKSKEETIAGRKTKVFRIFRLDFLGLDEFSTLRATLKLDSAFPVKFDESTQLPSVSPLKLFASIEHNQTAIRLVNWMTHWNAKDGVKFGVVQPTTSVDEADAVLVVLKGAPGRIVDPAIYVSDWGNFTTLTGYLAVMKEGNLKVVWKATLLANEDAATMKDGLIEKELAKRLKARK